VKRGCSGLSPVLNLHAAWEDGPQDEGSSELRAKE
jgi:hypothetical protein